MAEVLKPLQWVGSAHDDLVAFPDAARNDAGYQLFQVQRGDDPDDFKPMKGIGRGVYEIRIHTQTEHRVFYVAKFAEAVYVLHAFENARERRPSAMSNSRNGAMRKSSRRERDEPFISHVTPADGNVFADIGFPPEEAENLFVRGADARGGTDDRVAQANSGEGSEVVRGDAAANQRSGARQVRQVQHRHVDLDAGPAPGMRVRVNVRPNAA